MTELKYRILLKRKMWSAILELKFLRAERWIQEHELGVAFGFLMTLLFLFQVALFLS